MSTWDIEKLFSEKTSYNVISREGSISGIVYENEPYLGKPSRVFAYLGIPESIDEKVPAMVCIHGGGGKAFKEWVELWVKRGYAAISMDFGGMEPDGKNLPTADRNRHMRQNSLSVWAGKICGRITLSPPLSAPIIFYGLIRGLTPNTLPPPV